MDSLSVIAILSAGFAVLLIAAGARQMAMDEGARISGRLQRGSRGALNAFRLGADVRLAERQRSSRLLTRLDESLDDFGWARRTRIQLHRAEVHLLLFEYYLMRLVLGVVAGVLVVLVWGAPLAYFAGIVAGLFAWYLPSAWIHRRIERRMRMLEGQLDAALTGIASTLRAGFSFLQACQLAVPQLEWPLRNEVEAVLEESNLGVSMEDALQKMAQRLENYEVDITVNAVMINRSVGGSLAEILDSVAGTLRERRELKGHVMSLTAQQRLSAVFVACVPVFMGGLLALTSWQFMKPLFLTTTGNVLMGIGIVGDVLGFLVMRRLTRIDF